MQGKDFRENDVRLLLVSFLLCAFCVWSLSLIFLVFFAIAYSFLFLQKSKKKQRGIIFYKSLCFFCIVWTFFICLAHLIDFENFRFTFNFGYENIINSFYIALQYTLKLFVVALLGLNLFIIASPKDYALALTYYFSFISKKNAWKVGLMSLLTLKYFYELFELCIELAKSVNYRFKNRLSLRKKIIYYTSNLLKILVDKNYSLSIALFSRGFNKPEMFEKKWNSICSKSNIEMHASILIFNLIPCIIKIFSNIKY